MRVAAVQLNSTNDKDRNLEVAARLVGEAAADGAELVVLPEKWNLLGDGATSSRRRRAARRPPTLTAARGVGARARRSACSPAASPSASRAPSGSSTPRA